MRLSSESDAKIEFQKLFYKQLFFDLFIEMPQHFLEERFYKIQIDLFKRYTEILAQQGYEKMFFFDQLEFCDRNQFLEMVYYHLVEALKTFPMGKIGDQIELQQELDSHDFFLVEQSLLGALPRAHDVFSQKFLEGRHKWFFENNYFNFLIHIIKSKWLKGVVANGVIKTGMYHEQLQSVSLKPINVTSLPTEVDVKQIGDDYRTFEKFFHKQLEMSRNNTYEETKGILKSWGLEKAIVRLYADICGYLNEDTTINVQEWRVYCKTKSINRITKRFIKDLNDDIRNFFVFTPVNIGGDVNWRIPKEFNFTLIKVKDVRSFRKRFPRPIGEHLKSIQKKYSHLLFHTANYKNNDFPFVKEEVVRGWNKLLDLINLHEWSPAAYKANFKETFAFSSNKKGIKWYKAEYHNQYNLPLDNEAFKKKMNYYKKNLLPLSKTGNDLANRLINSFSLYRESLELESHNMSFSYGSLWLCLEVLTRNYHTSKVADIVSFVPASHTDEFYTKKTVENLDSIAIESIYRQRSELYRLVIHELGELRNKLIFHKRDIFLIQGWRLKKHIQLLRKIVRLVQVVVAGELLRNGSIRKMEDVKIAIESRIKKS